MFIAPDATVSRCLPPPPLLLLDRLHLVIVALGLISGIEGLQDQ